MNVKITKQNAMNEFLEISIPLRSAEEWETKVRPALHALDRRQFELNLRVLKVNQEVGKLDDPTFRALQEILAGLNNIMIEREPEPTPVPEELKEFLPAPSADGEGEVL